MKPFFLFSKEETETKVANNRLLSYAVGLTGQNMTYNFVSSRLFTFLNTILKISPEKTGLITGISTLWDAVNDPIVGSLLDHRKYKPGYKLRPFLLWTPILIGIFVAMMFFDLGLSQNGTIFYILVLYILFDVFYSLQDVSIWGIAAMSSPDSAERQRVTQWISIGAGAGGTIAGLFPMFKDMFVKNGVMTEKTAFMLGAAVFGIGGMLIAMLAYRMKEKVEQTEEQSDKLFSSLLNLRKNKTLIIVCLARILAFFIGANDRFMKTGPIIAVMVIIGSTQILTNMKDIAHRSLLTNSIDELELETGERTEGITFSMQNFVSKLTGAISNIIKGFLLSWLGFDENIKHADNVTVIGAQTSKRFLKYRWHQFILGPAIGAVLYVIVISFVKDDKEYTASVERRLKEKREAMAAVNAE